MEIQGIKNTALKTLSTIGSGAKEAVFWAGRRIKWLIDVVAGLEIPTKIYNLAAYILRNLMNLASWSGDKLSSGSSWSWQTAKVAGNWTWQTISSIASSILENGKILTSWTWQQGQVVKESALKGISAGGAFMMTNPGLALSGFGLSAAAVTVRRMDWAGTNQNINIALDVCTVVAAAFAGYALAAAPLLV
ncbi:MAG: hypothetical protein K940chlam3_01495 [Chlamydiae bacterium]|nr:hypothetical protein [Chlamydiota bacterium]